MAGTVSRLPGMEHSGRGTGAGTASAAGKGRMSSDRGAGGAVAKPALLSEIRLEQEDRISTGFKELDRVLGDGIVAGSWCL